MNQAHHHIAISNAHGQARNGMAPNRLSRCGLTMIVMGASFMLYYLGLFGSVDGPLTPDNIGITLASWGVTRRHVVIFLLSILIGALAWNWVFNLASFAMGSRLTCMATGKGAAGVCGATATRIRRVSKGSGRTVVEYVCAHGHRRSTAHFHPVKKGAPGHTVWLVSLACLLMAVFCA